MVYYPAEMGSVKLNLIPKNFEIRLTGIIISEVPKGIGIEYCSEVYFGSSKHQTQKRKLILALRNLQSADNH